MEKKRINSGLKYEQLIEHLKPIIDHSCVGDRLPSYNELRKTFGVSQATVDKALNLLTRQGILVKKPGQGIFVSSREYGKGGANKVIDLITPGRDDAWLLKIIRCTHEVLDEKGYGLNISITGNNAEHEWKMLQRSRMNGSAGIIFIPCWETHENVQALEQCGHVKPIVQFDRRYTSVKTDFVSPDHYKGALIATQYLIAKNHVRIGIVRDKILNWTSQQERFRGYRDALKLAGIVQNLQGEIRVDFEDESFSAVEFQRVLSSKQHPTAFFTQNNTLAQQFYRQAYTLGLRIPQDFCVVGFGDPIVAPELIPPLTYALQPTQEVIRKAVDALIARIVNPSLPICEEILPVEKVIVGGSCREHLTNHIVTEQSEVTLEKGSLSTICEK